MNRLAYLGLGGNVGDRAENIKQAFFRLQNHSHINLKRISAIYETAPVGYLNQDLFYNVVCEIETTATAPELLQIILEIEQQLHRERTIRWGPRTIDIDLLLYQDQVIELDELIVPHPRMTERAFVIVPLAELIPDGFIPGQQQTVQEMQAKLLETQKISKLDINIWNAIGRCLR